MHDDLGQRVPFLWLHYLCRDGPCPSGSCSPSTARICSLLPSASTPKYSLPLLNDHDRARGFSLDSCRNVKNERHHTQERDNRPQLNSHLSLDVTLSRWLDFAEQNFQVMPQCRLFYAIHCSVWCPPGVILGHCLITLRLLVSCT